MRKILLMSDSPALNTGFGKVLRYIASFLVMQPEYEIKVIGWYDYHKNDAISLPFEVIPTDRNNIRDRYGFDTFNRVVSEFKPDIVFTLGDEWLIRYVRDCQLRNSFKWVAYVPIDSAPIPKDYIQTYKAVDALVAYGEFGKSVIKMRDSSIPVSIIPHGVDLSVFHKFDHKFVIPCLKEKENPFVVGMVGRNQPRKMIPHLLKMFRLFIQPWVKCRDCKFMVYESNITKCALCGSEMLLHGEKKNNAFLFLHCALDDVGWDIPDLIERYELENHVLYSKNMVVGRGVSEKTLCELYNGMDVFTLPTQGEGFGLPILEAMACGVPTVVTNYSGHIDYCYGVSELIKVSDYITEPKTNMERAVVDLMDYVMRMEKLYYDKKMFVNKWNDYLKNEYQIHDYSELICGQELRQKMSESSVIRAKTYSWNNILPIWVKLFNQL